jgi:hypothetical protein
MSGTIYDSHALGLRNIQPRNLGAVGQAFNQLERWANTIPFLEMTNTQLAPQFTVTATSMADVTNFAASVTPTRNGQLILFLVNGQLTRATGLGTLQARSKLTVGSTVTFPPGNWYVSTAFGQFTGVIPVVASSQRTHILQIEALTTTGSWLMRSPDSSITVLTI